MRPRPATTSRVRRASRKAWMRWCRPRSRARVRCRRRAATRRCPRPRSAPPSTSWCRRPSSPQLFNLAAALLFIVDPLESLKAYKDSSVAMMRAAQARGHVIWAAEQTHLHWSKNRVSAQATRISLTDNDEDWYRGHDTDLTPLKHSTPAPLP